MNYYIDFDNTLYETAKLTNLILEEIVNFIVETTNTDKILVNKYIDENFNSTTVKLFEFAETIAQYFNADSKKIVENIDKIITNGEEITFDDARKFLKRIKEEGNKVIIVTYIPKNNYGYQMKKILGSGLSEYFDALIITSELKATLDLDYKNGIVIDDDPRDLNQLYERNPIKVIRIRKPNNKRSKIEMENKNIEEYESFDDIV